MYRIKRSNGAFFASIAPNIILGPNNPSSNRTPVNLIGRNKVSYGEAQNENFLWLTENFASTSAPTGAVKGQLWYNYTNDDNTGTGGELMIAPMDNVASGAWLQVPVIAEMTTEPSQSNAGRMIIYKKNRLKVRMNDEWYSVVTEVPKDQQLQTILPIRYNESQYNGKNTKFRHTGDGASILSRFNDGGYLTADGLLGGVTEGALRYGASYAWEADVLARDATNTRICKFWKIKGMFFILPSNEQSGTPDPRKIEVFNPDTIIYEVVDQTPGAEKWDITAEADRTEPASGVAPEDVLAGDHYGLIFKGNVNNAGGATTDLRWNILFKMIGSTTSLADKSTDG